MDRELITTAQAADVLGVRVTTIYSYVSRGVLRPADSTRSRHAGTVFRRSEVVALSEARRRSRTGHFELTIDSAVTRIEPSGVLLYRGIDVAELALKQPFEAVAEIVWDGTDDNFGWPDVSLPEPPPSHTHRDLIRWAIGLAGLTDSARDSLSAGHFRDAGRRTIRSVGVSLASANNGRVTGRIAELIQAGVRADETRAEVADELDVALGLLADHELATSTLAARAAASTGADPYAVMTAGVSALGGLRHGGASAGAYDVLRDVIDDRPMTSSDQVPGFGHAVYTDTDPRATVLLDRVALLDDRTAAAVDQLALRVRRQSGLAPNVDLGLAALSLACGLPRHTGEVIFTVARLAGFVAHGIEEQGHPLRFRPRASYTGEPPRMTAGPV